MSSLFYFLADLYPWWGLPLALILLEAANRDRRRNQQRKFLKKAAVASILLALSAGYFYVGRDEVSASMQRFERNMK